MKLILSVISSKENLQHSSLVTLNQENATLGRQEDNTIVLYDPKLFISNHHALIEYQDQAYFIIDISTNGVFVNSSTRPLGKGNRIKLKDGDKIQIGDYNISVQLIDPNKLSGFAPRDDFALTKPENRVDDPFSNLNTDPIDELIQKNENFPPKQASNSTADDLFAGFPWNPHELNQKEDDHSFEHVPPQKNVFEQPLQPKPSPKPDSTFDDWPFPDPNLKIEEDISHKETASLPEERAKPSIPTSEIRHEEPIGKVLNSGEVPSDYLKQFLLGAQLDDSSVGALSPETFFIVGAIIRAAIQGARDVLEGRAKIKNEMHLDVTYIKPRENNPIKFSASTDEALIKLLSPPQKGYLPAERAITEAFDDIKAHQYSVIAGMKSALLTILKRFDPNTLEQRLQKKSPITSNIPIHRQAMLWELFEELYETLEQETKDNFYHLFGQAFADTYADLMNKIKNNNPHI